MKCDMIMVHYGELGTKGENRKLFIRQLNHNIKDALSSFSGVSISSDHDHTYITLTENNENDILLRLQDISGIQRLSTVYKSKKEIEAICEASLQILRKEEGKTFKVEAKRADKTYPLDSYGIAREVGGYILDRTDLSVDVHHPDIRLSVDLRRDAAYCSAHSYPGAGGYPLGMNGKVMMLLSGGIDSPVASYLLLRRGIRLECIHFAAPPYTSSAVLTKLEDIIKALSIYQKEIKLSIIPFTKLQEAIYANVDEPYCITIMRRMMMRIAISLAKNNHCLGIATGESIGQVASQTLDSMIAINDVTNYPIIRPLATSDKIDIINIAKRIGTYDISIRPYEDCCTIFAPKKPKTKPKVEECIAYEKKWDYESMIEDCLKNVTQELYVNGVKKDFSK